MQEQVKQIAERIRELREINQVELEVLAGELGLPIGLYRDYEGAAADIPVGVLYNIANYFQIELTSLLTGEEPRLRTYCLTRNGKGVSVERRKDYKYQSLAYNFIHKKAEPFLVTVKPEATETPVSFNSHPGQEFDYVLEGVLKVVLNGYEVILNQGDSLFYDSSIKHGMKAMNGQAAQFLAIVL